MPLFPKVRRRNNQYATLLLGPSLRDDESCLDRLAEADFIGQQSALGEWGRKGKKCGVDLMRIQIYLSTSDCSSELLDVVGGTALGEIKCKIFGVIVGNLHDRRPSCVRPVVGSSHRDCSCPSSGGQTL